METDFSQDWGGAGGALDSVLIFYQCNIETADPGFKNGWNMEDEDIITAFMAAQANGFGMEHCGSGWHDCLMNSGTYTQYYADGRHRHNAQYRHNQNMPNGIGLCGIKVLWWWTHCKATWIFICNYYGWDNLYFEE
jgi:hypothetical protein